MQAVGAWNPGAIGKNRVLSPPMGIREAQKGAWRGPFVVLSEARLDREGQVWQVIQVLGM